MLARRENNGDLSGKLNVANVFNKSEDVRKAPNNNNLPYNSSQQRSLAYQNLLRSSVVDIEKLKQLAWNGVPQRTSQIS